MEPSSVSFSVVCNPLRVRKSRMRCFSIRFVFFPPSPSQAQTDREHRNSGGPQIASRSDPGFRCRYEDFAPSPRWEETARAGRKDPPRFKRSRPEPRQGRLLSLLSSERRHKLTYVAMRQNQWSDKSWQEFMWKTDCVLQANERLADIKEGSQVQQRDAQLPVGAVAAAA